MKSKRQEEILALIQEQNIETQNQLIDALRKRGVKHLKVVDSKELALTPIDDMTISCRAHCICPPGTARKCTQRRQVPGSNAYVPAVAGLICAGEVINDIALNRV